MRNRGHVRDVEHVEAGVAEGFGEQHLGIRPDRGAPGVEVARIDEGGLDAEALQRVGQQVVRAAVQRARRHDVRAGAGDGGQAEVHGGLAAGDGDAGHAAFQRGDAFFQHRVGRVRNARIDVAGALHVEQRGGVVGILENEGRGQVDRRGARAGGRVGRRAGVQRQGVEAGIMGTAHDRICLRCAGGGIVALNAVVPLQPAAWLDFSQPLALHSSCVPTTPNQRQAAIMKVSEILKVKGNILYTVTPDTPLAEAVNTMAEKDIGSLVVMEFGELVGMLTFREVIKALHANGGAVGNGTVRKHMDDAPITVTPDTDVNEVRRIMLEKHARYLPVMDAKTLLGVISFYDVAKAVLEAQSFENKMLKAYIRDWPSEGDE